ncbi:MAG TPA: PilT/PilU family type 4a pilus ATPase [Candidatus Baltobacteraceae bacterium]|nr:PilT/PilU family type 4a pilus ATPase [Candidatus Baltobacteraceae bacterium]
MTAALAAVRLAEVLHFGRRRNASDVHLRCGVPPLVRVDGLLEAMSAPPLTEDEIEAIALAVLPDRSELERCGDVTVLYEAPQIGRVRVHGYETELGIAFAMRLLASQTPALESLGLPPAVSSLCALSKGLVLIAGPTGSGKSTLLASMIDAVNRRYAKHIVTIEDPVEYRHHPVKSLVNQRSIGSDVATFSSAVLGALRSDPDVILIGELRDAATMHAALTAAETGHLVLSTLHTGDAAQTIDRVVGAFGGDVQDQIRIQLAQTLAGVVSTRLLPRAEGTGRVCAVEVLLVNDAVRHIIRDGKTHQIGNVISTGRQFGMQTLESHVSELVARGDVAPEALRAVPA